MQTASLTLAPLIRELKVSIQILSGPHFIATKLEAFKRARSR
jgi:hypothetical protein